MDKDTQEFKDNLKLLQDEFQNYKDKKVIYKPYIQSMEDIAAWLEEKAK